MNVFKEEVQRVENVFKNEKRKYNFLIVWSTALCKLMKFVFRNM